MRSTHFRKWMKPWHNSQEPQFSVNWMQTVDFGRYHLPRNRSCSPPSSLHLGDTASRRCPLEFQAAPEHFQKRMTEVLSGLDGVLCLMDDVLVFGKDKEEHDERLTQALKKITAAGVTLNPKKCEFGKEQLKFLGHLIDREGIRADPDKITAITEMKAPTHVSELRRFMGMANQLGKFSPNLADLTQPLRQLLSKKSSWLWGPDQAQAFAKVKEELSKPTILHLYNPQAPTKVSADESSYSLGAVLMQQSDSTWKPVAYASRSLTETEKRYAQIERGFGFYMGM